MTRLGDACYRLLLHVFPAEFRRRHGAAMLVQFRAQRRTLRARPTALATLWLRAVGDGLTHGLAARADERRRVRRGGQPMHSLRQDMRHAWRAMRARPGATVATVLVLAIGIGLTSAIFGLSDPFMAKPLPFANPERLAVISLQSENRLPGPFPTLTDLRARTDLFVDVAAFTPGDIDNARVTLSDGNLVLPTASVSESFFSVLGLPIQLPPEWRAVPERGERPVVVLPDADVRVRALPVGASLPTQGGDVLRVVGVLSEAFLFPRDRVSPRLGALAPIADDWLLDVEIGPGGRSFRSTSRNAIARLADDVTPEIVQAVLSPPESTERPYSLAAESLRSYLTARQRPLALGAFAASLLIALVCAANVTNLLLARSVFRAREFGTRAALGASRSDLVRLVLIELGLLALMGSIAGLVLAGLALRAIDVLIPASYVALGHPRITARVVVFALSLGGVVMTGGAVPAWMVWRQAPSGLIAHMAAPESRGVRGLRFALAAGQSAVAMILVAGAALLGRSFMNLVWQDSGLDGAAVVVTASYPPGHIGEPLRLDIEAALNGLERLPGVSAAGAVYGPMADTFMAMTVVTIEGSSAPVQYKSVTPGYFDVVGSRLVAGRPLVQADRGTDNVVVNVRAAVEYWPDGRAVGQPIVRGNRQGTVVGVLADSFDTALDTAPRPTLFAYLGALPTGSRVNFVLRTTEPLDVVRRQVERALMTVNRSAIVTDVSLLGDRLSDSIRDRTFATVVLSIFAVAGISVCAAGLIGIVSFVIARRTREIAIRTAIGAEPRHVRRFVVREALSAALTGAAVGLAAAWWVSRWLESLVYGIEPRDTTTLMGGAVVMLVLVYVASWLPARRALRLSPTIALRAE